MNKYLLIEPDFPIPPKSKNHKNFLPIGLLKIATYFKESGHKVILKRGYPEGLLELRDIKSFNPDEIWITSLFTYWAEYVKKSVIYYKELFPKSKIVVGGIYASLFSENEVKSYTGCDEVIQGVLSKVENCIPDYSLLNGSNPKPIDYQIIHTSRGCPRHCKFCGTWKIEPKFESRNSIKDLIQFKKLVFYDNNLLMNDYIEDILNELILLKRDRKIIWCESQSGFDGRILLQKPYLAKMLKQAGFRYPRIAWDWDYSEYSNIKKQIDILIEGGFKTKDIFVFIIYNWDITFDDIEKKRIKCWKWKVQISDCRFRPLNQVFDYYNPRKIGQTSKEYYIHKKAGWTGCLIKKFRRHVRMQNICVRQNIPFYSKEFERKHYKNLMLKVKGIHKLDKKVEFLENNNISYWFPDSATQSNNIIQSQLSVIN